MSQHDNNERVSWPQAFRQIRSEKVIISPEIEVTSVHSKGKKIRKSSPETN